MIEKEKSVEFGSSTDSIKHNILRTTNRQNYINSNVLTPLTQQIFDEFFKPVFDQLNQKERAEKLARRQYLENILCKVVLK